MTTLREKLGRKARCYANDSPSGREIRRAFFGGSLVMFIWLLLLTLVTILGFVCVYISLEWFLKKISLIKLKIEKLEKYVLSITPRV